jgi:hypothetical protein
VDFRDLGREAGAKPAFRFAIVAPAGAIPDNSLWPTYQKARHSLPRFVLHRMKEAANWAA